jgi:TRAP-type uncharacterized transport system substrate-binding protein
LTYDLLIKNGLVVDGTGVAPLDVPLHPAAERYWRERGYLT